MTGTDEKPPVFRSWNHWYGLVIGLLVAVITGLFLFSIAFS